MLFLEGLSRFGIGSWTEIGKLIGTKDDIRCESHFNVLFTDVETEEFFAEEIIDSETTINADVKDEEINLSQ